MNLRRWRVARESLVPGYWQVLPGRYWTRRGASQAARALNQTILNMGGPARREIIRSRYAAITDKRLRDFARAHLEKLSPGTI